MAPASLSCRAARHPAAGFLGSRSEAIDGAPWVDGGREAYEDRYLLENAAALDPLNEAAVTPQRQTAHDAAAARAAGGTAGLYRLRRGNAGGAVPAVAAWFGKPPGMSYAALEPLATAGGAVLWRRQMVLGPSPEFCLQSAWPLAMPAPFVPAWVRWRRVWPEPSSRSG